MTDRHQRAANARRAKQHKAIRDKIHSLYAVQEACGRASAILKDVQDKVPKSPHGAGPDGWLSNVLRHLDMLAETMRREEESIRSQM